jgi:myo-inositol-1(or 4)-monophosphatase
VDSESSPSARDVDFQWLEEIVRSAGDLALRHFGRVRSSRKADRTLVTIADQEVEAFLREALAEAFPADGVLGEEMGMHAGTSRRMWAVDPIDGTAAYASGLPVWAVSVGLLEDGMPVAGMVYLPLVGELYLSHGHDALFNGQPISADTGAYVDDESFLCVTSEVHRTYRIDFIGKTRALGSTAAHMCYVARGSAIGAFLGRPSLWDIAGALPILRAAGGDVRCLSGRPFDLAALAAGSRYPEPVLAGASWALDYFSQRIEGVRQPN